MLKHKTDECKINVLSEHVLDKR
jgi:hypothetical protein